LSGQASVLVVMGVSGVGKTTLARALAERLGWTFEEGDELHPAANIAKMQAGIPLTDADRAPWLDAIGDWIDQQLGASRSGVITCSALKRAYRDRIAKGRPQVSFVFIQLDQADVAARIAGRKGHFMPPSLLASQFADLEPPGPDEPVIVVDGAAPIPIQIEAVVRRLAPSTPSRSPSPCG
jgi:gluconokinase